jgi:simple sugar transport system permease protein
MSETYNKLVKKMGIPRLIITTFFIIVWIMVFAKGLPAASLFSDSVRRFGMNGVLVLAMVPAIHCGIGPNFALPIGIICGILGGLISIQVGAGGLGGFLLAIAIAIPFSVLVGWLYGIMLNKIKGSEMLVATYTGFAFVSLMSIAWIVLPFTHPEMRWPIGQGLRVTIALESTFGYILNNFLAIEAGTLVIPTGMLLFFGLMCYVMWIFSRSKHGIAMKASGDNPKFAAASGINVDNYRILGTILSTALGAIGYIVYAQSYGFIQLYQAPLMMAFPAVAAILIGGATAKKARISHVVIGAFLFNGLLTIALPVASAFFDGGNISEALRMIVQNGIILYALTQVGGGE